MAQSVVEQAVEQPLGGLLLDAEVVDVNPDQAIVRFIQKEGEGIVPIDDFKVASSDDPKVSVGDKVTVHVENLSHDGHRWIVSADKAARLKCFRRVQSAYRKEALVDGEVVATIEGGYTVDIGVRAFLPGSQLSVRPVRNPDEVLGKKLQFKIIRFDKGRQNVVVSRRVILEEERDKALGLLKEGTIIAGVVKGFASYGAFIDLGAGVEGLLHLKDISWNRVQRPQEVVKNGQSLTLKILKIDFENKRVSLGLRQLQGDPWVDAAEKYAVGTRVTGLVVSKTDYGCFLEVVPGLEGLVLAAGPGVSATEQKRMKTIDVGDEIAARVTALDVSHQRMSLVVCD